MDGSHEPQEHLGEAEASPEVNVGQVANTVMVNGDQVINVGGRLQWTKEANVDDLVEAERKLDEAIRLWSFRALIPVIVTVVVAVVAGSASWFIADFFDPVDYTGHALKGVLAVVALSSAAYAAIAWAAASETRRRFLLLDACAARQWAEVRVELAMRGHYGPNDRLVLACMGHAAVTKRLFHVATAAIVGKFWR